MTPSGIEPATFQLVAHAHIYRYQNGHWFVWSLFPEICLSILDASCGVEILEFRTENSNGDLIPAGRFHLFYRPRRPLGRVAI
jgi:hypothetical protein